MPDAEDATRFRHAQTYWVEHEGRVLKFAVVHLDDGARRFFVPAETKDEEAFEVITPRYEGFWKSSQIADEELPWPQPDAAWRHREAFIQALDRIEAAARRIAYRGVSPCRLCGIGNGSQSIQLDVWEWPEGFRHYVVDHQVRHGVTPPSTA